MKNLAGVIDEASQVSLLGSINNQVIIYSEHIATTDSHTFITFLPGICHLLADDLRTHGKDKQKGSLA